MNFEMILVWFLDTGSSGPTYAVNDLVNPMPGDKEEGSVLCDRSLQTAVLAIWSSGTASCKPASLLVLLYPAPALDK